MPTQGPRQLRTQESMNKALQDLLSARRQDIPASQGEAKRQLERLGLDSEEYRHLME